MIVLWWILGIVGWLGIGFFVMLLFHQVDMKFDLDLVGRESPNPMAFVVWLIWPIALIALLIVFPIWRYDKWVQK